VLDELLTARPDLREPAEQGRLKILVLVTRLILAGHVEDHVIAGDADADLRVDAVLLCKPRVEERAREPEHPGACPEPLVADDVESAPEVAAAEHTSVVVDECARFGIQLPAELLELMPGWSNLLACIGVKLSTRRAAGPIRLQRFRQAGG
jgi:hypothetical protein